jgi:hypothetical protein
MRVDILITGGLLFIWDVVLSFQNIVLVAISQQKSDFGTPKMENTHFVGRNRKRKGQAWVWYRIAGKICNDQRHDLA